MEKSFRWSSSSSSDDVDSCDRNRTNGDTSQAGQNSWPPRREGPEKRRQIRIEAQHQNHTFYCSSVPTWLESNSDHRRKLQDYCRRGAQSGFIFTIFIIFHRIVARRCVLHQLRHCSAEWCAEKSDSKAVASRISAPRKSERRRAVIAR